MYRIGYIIGAAMMVVGVLILTGYLMDAPEQFGGEMLRTMFGIVLILYGIYRLVLTGMQRRRRFEQ